MMRLNSFSSKIVDSNPLIAKLPTVSVPDERQTLAVVYASEAGNNSLKTASAEAR